MVINAVINVAEFVQEFNCSVGAESCRPFENHTLRSLNTSTISRHLSNNKVLISSYPTRCFASATYTISIFPQPSSNIHVHSIRPQPCPHIMILSSFIIFVLNANLRQMLQSLSKMFTSVSLNKAEDLIVPLFHNINKIKRIWALDFACRIIQFQPVLQFICRIHLDGHVHLSDGYKQFFRL